MHIPEQKLKHILLESGMVEETAFAESKAESFRSGQALQDVLIGRGYLSEDYLTELLQSYFDVPKIDLKTVTIPKATLELIPETFAKAKNIILFEFD